VQRNLNVLDRDRSYTDMNVNNKSYNILWT